MAPLFGRMIACMKDQILKEYGARQHQQSHVSISLVLEDSEHLNYSLAEAFKIYVCVQCSDPWEAGRIGVLESASSGLKAFSAHPS